MWCKKCNTELNDAICPVCGSTTVEDLPVEIFWCDECMVPIIQTSNQSNKGICPRCARKTVYLATDLRPVFPEERLLLASLLKENPEKMMKKAIWATNSKYYIDGSKAFELSSKKLAEVDTSQVAEEIKKNQDCINYDAFNQQIYAFADTNKTRLDYLKDHQ